MANIPFLNNAYFSSRVGIGVTPSYDLDVAGTLGVGGLPFDNTSTSVLVQDQTLAADTVINGDFDTDTNWNKGTAWTINNGTSNISGAQTAVSYMSQSSVLTSPHNKTYLVTYTISNITAGDIRINLGGYNTGVIRTSNGTYTEEIIPTNPSANHLLYVQASIDAICDFDNISCQEVTSSSDQIQKRQLGEAAFTDGPFLPLTGGTLSGDLYLNDGVGASPSMYFKNQANNYWRLNTETDNSFSIKQGTTLKGGWTSSLLSLNTSLTLGSNAVQKDLKVYGNLAGEYMLYEGSTSKLRLYTTAGTAAIDVFTVSAAQPGYPQIRVGRDAAQWVGFYTTDRDGYIVTRQDETDAGTNTLNFDIWDSGTGIHTWNWNSANGSGASSVNRMSLNKTGNLTVTGTIDSGAITAPTFLGDLNGTINTVTTAVTKANATNDATVATTAFVQNLIGTIPAGLVFQGTWDARTQAEGGAAGDRGNPALADGVGTTGNFYIVSNSGSVNLDGVTDWVTGDWAVFIEQGATDAWEKIDNSSVLDGAGTGDKIAKWDGSGTSNTLTNSLITDDGTNISLLDNTAASGQNPISYIYGHDSGTATAKYGKMQIDTNGNFHITAEDQYLYLNAANYIQSSKVHIMNEDVFMYKGKHIRFLDGPGDSWNDVLGLTASTDIIQIGAIASFNSGVGEVAFYAANAEKMRLDVSGNLGIGNEEPLDKLDVTGVVNSSKNIVSNAVYTTFTARSNRTVNDYGGLNKNYLKLDLVTPGAATTGEASQHAYADLRIQLANNAASTAMADIMTLRYNGNVGIGNTVPYSKLQVGDPESTTQTMLTIASRYNNTAPPALNFRSGHPTNSEVWNMAQIRGDDDGSFSGRLEFLTRSPSAQGSANVVVERMRIDDEGRIKFNNYGSTNQVGVPTYLLGTDSSGNIVKTLGSGIPGGPYLPLAGGTVTGTLTVNAPFVNNGWSQVMSPQMASPASGGHEYEVARAFVNPVSWNSTGVINIDLIAAYPNAGVTKSYAIRWGYSNEYDIDLVSVTGGGTDTNNFELFLGPVTAVPGSATMKYLPIMARGKYYVQYRALVRTNRNLTTNANSTASNTLYVTPTAVATVIADFTTTSNVEFSGSATNINIGSGAAVAIGMADGVLPQAKLDVAGGIKIANDSSTAALINVGTLRYRESGNNSYIDMCMRTATGVTNASFAWINIVQNNF